MTATREICSTEAMAVELLTDEPFLEGSYFRGLASGEMSKKEFARSQTQFFYAVGFFSRNLASLAARLPTSAGRAVLIHNLSEEHGFDEENPALGFRPPLAHDRTFRQFLKSLGLGEEAFAVSPPEAPVQAFNLALLDACSAEEPGFAFAALGMIEHVFSEVSALISRRVVELGWVKADALVHYCLHAEIDQRHAAEFFEAAEEAGADRELSARGLAFGRYIFSRLYEDLYFKNK